jgi:acyl-coenzyme A thioesterase PaaI-like protein
VLTVEFKVNLMSPAAGERFLARGNVIKPGRTLTVVDAEVFTAERGNEKTVAKLLATMMCLEGKTDAPSGG